MFALFLAAFFSLRLAIVQQFQIEISHVYRSGLLTGFFHDLAFCFIPLAFYFLIRSYSRSLARAVEWFSWILLYAMALANTCYLLFFRRPLDPQMVRYGSGNLWEVRGILFHFLAYTWIDVSLVLFVVACIFRFGRRSSFLQLRQKKARFSQSFALMILMLVLFQCVKQVPIWFKIPRMDESPLAQSVPLRWWKKWRVASTASAHPAGDAEDARRILAQFRQMNADALPPAPASIAASGAVTATPVLNWVSDPKHVRDLRAQFGLPLAGSPNVILVFLESNRAFEFLNPEISAVVYPHLHQVFKEHGILFSQTYSSANYTVEGQFATLCSAMDRMDGPPVYASSPYLQIHCLPELLTQAGYETYWLNPFDRNFSGKFLFESRHGMKEFFDQDFFGKVDHLGNQTEWGVSDEEFFQKSLAKLEELGSGPKPFFAHLLNIGTHAPWHHFQGHDLPPAFSDLFKGEANHQAYLGAVYAEDQALGHFFDAFFKSKLAANTVVIVSSDHGNGVTPTYPKLASHQQRLLWPRIIFGAVSAGIKKPKEIRYPVHQMDIAPLIANFTGITGPEAWLGRDPTLGSGTPWVRRTGDQISYRTPNKLCYTLTSQNKVRCYDAPAEVDPLLKTELKEVDEDKSLTRDMRRVIWADEDLLDTGTF